MIEWLGVKRDFICFMMHLFFNVFLVVARPCVISTRSCANNLF